MICQTVEELTALIGTRPACRALGASPATIYRRRRPPQPRPARPRPTPARALSEPERQQVLDLLHSERFVDVSPEETYATLDEGTYLCSTRTMYRILAARHGGVRERRDQLTHPAYAKPELLAKRPNELWSWDVSKLKGPAKWTYFYLYVILDVFSRYIVGWTVQHRENAQLATALIEQAAGQQQITPKILTLHARSRGAAARQAGRVPAGRPGGWFTMHLLVQSLSSRSNRGAGTSILRPFRWPLVTWIARSSPRWTLCNTVWRAQPSWRAASASGT
jgi:transposase InsO family protein